MKRHGTVLILIVACLASVFVDAQIATAGEDWPQWRFDARRSAASPQELAPTLHLQWVRSFPLPHRAWPIQPKLEFDQIYEPIVLGKHLIVGSTRDDSVRAFHTETGEEVWQFVTDGPVRMAPTGYRGKVYVASDDGYLYCLDAAEGRLLWKFRGGPSDRKILGNERLVSTWPARGGPVVAEDGVVYFAASIWPFMGTFIHALDAESGQPVWTNDGDGSMYIQQPHHTNSFAGVAPQGPLVVDGDRLLIPGGRSVPACYDRHTGKFLYFHLEENGKRGGGFQAVVAGPLFVNGGYAFQTDTGAALGSVRGPLTGDGRVLYHYDDFKDEFVALDLATSALEVVEYTDRKGKKQTREQWKIEELWSLEAPACEALIMSGARLYAGGENKVLAIDLPSVRHEPDSHDGAADQTADGTDNKDNANDEDQAAEQPTLADVVPTVSWKTEITGSVVRLVAADDRLFVVTLEGRIYCFGPDATEPRIHDLVDPAIARVEAIEPQAQKILSAAGTDEGYAICWGVESGELLAALASMSELHIVAVDPDPNRVAAARERLMAAGLYGDRVSVHVGTPATFEVPPYMASVMFSEREDVLPLGDGQDTADGDPAELFRRLLQSLRPYGGTACWNLSSDQRTRLTTALAADEEAAQFEMTADEGDWTIIRRTGQLPGSANWTHEHADAANTRVSKDQLVKAPLGILWFGGPTHEGVLPRHGHGPAPQVVDGRVIIEGVDMLRAVDSYTGRLLWERSLPGVGHFFSNLGHQPGANATGTNFISMPDGIYVAYGPKCLRLSPETGETILEFSLPPAEEGGETPNWGYINVVDDYLIAGADPIVSERDDDGRAQFGKTDNLSSSKRLVVLNRHDGKVQWWVEAINDFRHNAICAGGGRLYCVDLLSQGELARMKRRGEVPTTKSRLLALKLANGELVWSSDNDVFGTWLSYSAEHDVLVEAGQPARDHLNDEPVGMRAYQASDGMVLWYEKYSGPAMIHGDEILTQSTGYELWTGKPLMREDPVSGVLVPWKWTRNYGCNIPAASENLLTFRSGAAGYFDLAGDGGTGNLGGFRSGCTNNLIVAGGILNAPDYTRSCTCSYQNQTSLALVHMPEAEMWTQFSTSGEPEIKNLGLNLGAPGHRRGDGGRMWFNENDAVTVEFTGDGFYNTHTSGVSGEMPDYWVGASGCCGIRRIEIDPKLQTGDGATARYTLRLHFCDPDNGEPGKRVFNVDVQGVRVLDDFDIAREAGGRHRTIVVEFADVDVAEKLVIEFSGQLEADADPATMPLLNALEVVQQP